MLTESAGIQGYGSEDFGAADLGDRRRTRRLVALADAIARHPAGSLPEKLHEPAQHQALCPLLPPAGVTHAAVLRAHRELTLRRMRSHPGPVLVLHDDTELDFTSRASLEGLGRIGNGKRRGYICHNSLAVAPPTGEVPGLAYQVLHRRAAAPRREAQRARRERGDRQS